MVRLSYEAGVHWFWLSCKSPQKSEFLLTADFISYQHQHQLLVAFDYCSIVTSVYISSPAKRKSKRQNPCGVVGFRIACSSNTPRSSWRDRGARMLRRAVITTLLTHQTVSTFSVRPRPYKLTQMSTFTSASKGSLGSGKNDVDEMLQGLQTYTEGAAGATTTAEERDEAAKMRSGGSGVVDCNTSSGGGDSCGPNTPSDPDLPPVQIDPEGTFKYVLISATAPAGGPVRYLVRGNQRAAYHKDAARPTLQILESKVTA